MSNLQSQLHQQSAQHTAQVDAQWRDWRRYLEGKQTILTTQAAAHDALMFEQDADGDLAMQQAQANLDLIPRANRVLFDRVLEYSQQELELQAETARREAGGRGPALDADALELQAITLLLEYATGHGTDDGRGRVPVGHGEDASISWYSVDVTHLERAPDDMDYTAGAHAPADVRIRLLVVGGAGIVMLVVLWFVWFGGGSSTTDAETATVTGPTANELLIPVWPVTTISITDTEGQVTTLPVQAVSTFSHLSRPAPPAAAWLTTMTWPVTLCLPDEIDIDTVATVRLQASGITPERIYTVTTLPAVTDLHLAVCDNHTTIRTGYLNETRLPPAARVGEPLALDVAAAQTAAQTITLQEVIVTGPGTDPTLPANQQQVVVMMSSPADLDWPALAPTLTFVNGQQIPAADIQVHATGVQVRYLTPLISIPTEVSWHMTAPDTNQALRWQFVLEPPPERTTVLEQYLQVMDIQAAPLVSGQPLSLTLVLTSVAPEPLLVTEQDILLRQGTTVLAVPSLPALRTPLTTDARRSITLQITIDPRQPLELRVGAQQYMVSLP